MVVEHRGKTPRIADSAFVAPTAVIVGDVEIGADSSVWFGAVIRAEGGSIHIGARCAIEDNAVIHAGENDVTALGPGVTIGHCAVVDGCRIEAGAQIGANAVVLHDARVGEGAIVAAGSVVTAGQAVPARSAAIGAPALAQPIDGAAATWIAHTATDNARLALEYRNEGLGDPALHETPSTFSRRKRHIVTSDERLRHL